MWNAHKDDMMFHIFPYQHFMSIALTVQYFEINWISGATYGLYHVIDKCMRIPRKLAIHNT